MERTYQRAYYLSHLGRERRERGVCKPSEAERKEQTVRKPSDAERFWARVNKKEDDCWKWVGGYFRQGYGALRVKERMVKAHRFAYELLAGPIPEGMTIDHLCRNRACVNPAHLEVVDFRTNILRGVGAAAQNARKTHCVKGHPFNQQNTYLFAGRRTCRKCLRQRNQIYYRRKIQGFDKDMFVV